MREALERRHRGEVDVLVISIHADIEFMPTPSVPRLRDFREIARAGADTFVAGSAVFNAGRAEDPHRYDSVIQAFRDELAKA